MGTDIKKVEPGGKAKGNKMQDAVSGTEAIRTWDEHMIGPQALADRLGTNRDNGLTPDQANQKHSEWGDNALQKKEATPWYIVFL
jgi:sodium/potassium-transporting ATPase subunit alpha